MIKLMHLKDKNKQKKENPNQQVSAAQLRVQKDLDELELPRTIKLDFPDANNILSFTVVVSPDEGFYKGGIFRFSFAINTNYPHEPPKVLCTQVIYHPNIDLQGNICLNILREDWKPVLNLNAVLVGLQYLFLEPNADDPLNKEAAKTLRADRSNFAKIVTSTMKGGSFESQKYDNVTV
ncbi:NEDD8-conjugating enzyme UBC12 [Blastocladiella britannica]|nr:NEDD8-conjugating enzyme UBC12 [Blastocladiella britannica]